MSGKQRRDGDRRPSDRSNERRDRDDRRDAQPDDDQQRRIDMQESDSLTALKAILGKVAGLLTSLKLTQDECISLVEQLYGSVLDMDLKLAGETDDKRKASIQSHIKDTMVSRNGGKLVVEFPKVETPKEALSDSDTQSEARPEAPQKAEPPNKEPAAATPSPRPTPEPAAESKPEPAADSEAAPAVAPTPEPAADTEQADA